MENSNNTFPGDYPGKGDEFPSGGKFLTLAMAQPAPPATLRAPLGRSMPAVVSPEVKVAKNGRRGCFLGAVSALRVPRPSLLRPSPHADALVRV